MTYKRSGPIRSMVGLHEPPTVRRCRPWGAAVSDNFPPAVRAFSDRIGDSALFRPDLMA
jgi:hypothetical protein